MIIDAHQHVWDRSRAEYPWLDGAPVVWDRTYTFEELRPQLLECGVTGTVLVQSADNAEDTVLMQSVADAHPEVVAIVAYSPLEDPARVSDDLADFAHDGRIVGVRNLIHDQEDPDWLLRPDVDEGLGLLEASGVTFDVVSVLPRHLEHVPRIGERHPDLRMVIDHLSKPPIGEAVVEPWWSLIAAAAENPNVHAKISGLYPLEDPMGWSPELVRPFVEHALEVFGPERLMYGGDWPISVASGGYSRVFHGLEAVLADLGPEAAAQVWAGTARRFYRISDERPDGAALRTR